MAQELTGLSSVSPGPPALLSGVVTLFKDNNWHSESLQIIMNDYRSGVRQSINGTPLQDAATYVSFNLPSGIVFTLMDNFTALAPGGAVANLSGCGRCVDLVGTGRTEGISLIEANMNDCVSAFFWRMVDTDLGAITIFENSNFGGNRSVLFLCEWAGDDQVNSIDKWYLADRVSSVKWNSLNDRQVVSLFEHKDGTGVGYSNVKGWGSVKVIADLKTVGFGDKMSSFAWSGLAPVKEIIAPFTMNLSFGPSGSVGLSSNVTGKNASTVAQSVVVSLQNEDAQTLTVTSSETIVVGFVLTYTETWKVSGGIAETGGSLSLQLSQSYTTSKSQTTSSTKTISLEISETVAVEPLCNYNCTLTVQMGQLPETTYETTAQRWYDQPVTGATQDPLNNNWWKRVEQVTGTVAGGLACSSNVNTVETPLQS